MPATTLPVPTQNQVVALTPGAEIALPVASGQVGMEVVNGAIVLTFENGLTITLTGAAEAAAGTQHPHLAFQDVTLEVDNALLQALAGGDIATAAGAQAGGGGGSEYSDDFGQLDSESGTPPPGQGLQNEGPGTGENPNPGADFDTPPQQGATPEPDLTAPERPTILTFSDDTGIAGDHITADNTPTLTGIAEAGSVVSVYDNGTYLGATYADADGAWTFDGAALATPLTDGSHSFTVTATDAAENTSISSTTFTTIIDTTAPALTATALTVDEHSPAGTIVGTVVADDANAVTFSTESDLISIDPVTGEVSITEIAAASLDFTNAGALDNIDITLTDAAGNISHQTISVSILDVNDHAPTISGPASLTGGVEDTTPVTFTLADLMQNAHDIDTVGKLAVTPESLALVLTFALSDGSTANAGVMAYENGGWVYHSAGDSHYLGSSNFGLTYDAATETFTFTPATNFTGTVAMEYSVTDGVHAVLGSAALSIEEVNDAPSTYKYVTLGIMEGQSAIISDHILGTYIKGDVDGDSVTTTIVVPEQYADVLELTRSGTEWTISTKDPHFTSPCYITAISDDGHGGISETQLKLKIIPIDDNPVITAPDSVEFSVYQPSMIVASFSVQEFDGDAMSIKISDTEHFHVEQAGNMYNILMNDASALTSHVGTSLDIAITAQDTAHNGIDTHTLTVHVGDDPVALSDFTPHHVETMSIPGFADFYGYDLHPLFAGEQLSYHYTRDGVGFTSQYIESATLDSESDKIISITATNPDDDHSDTIQLHFLTGSNSDDALTSTQGDHALIYGHGGNDILTGGNGNDVLIGGSTSSSANDNDTLSGGAGNDILVGGGGDDILNGGSGNDILDGGSGHDTFLFTYDHAGLGPTDHYTDTIHSFTIGEDILNVHDLLQGATASDIGKYISTTQVDGNTALAISSHGDGHIDQMVVFESITNSPDTDLIQHMMNSGTLVI